MAHSSFIDCDDNNILNDNFMTTVKVELENAVVNDDENVAVEALGQLSSYEIATQPTYHIKQEDEYTIVETVSIEECIVPDVTQFVDAVFERPYVCDICGLRFKYDDVLAEHKKIHIPIDKPYECHSCGVSFHRKSSLKNHAKIHTSRNFPNSIDDNSVVSDEDKQEKIPPFETLRVSSVNDELGKSFQLSDNVVTFEEWPPIVHTSENVIPAEECSIEDSNNTSLQECNSIPQHSTVASSSEYDGVSVNKENDSHENNKFKPYCCPFCERSFAREKALFNHVRMHNDNYDECLESGPLSKQLKTEPLLKPEEIKVEEFNDKYERSKPYECPICNRTFAREKALNNHLRIHNDNYEPALQCQTCHDVFADGTSLREHVSTCSRTIITMSPPDDKCGIDYYEPDVSIGDHSRANSSMGSGNHECHVCRKRFKTRQKVFRHLWVHRQKLHNCEVCSAQFGTVQRLDEHRLTEHPSTAPFSCGKCGKSFTSKQGLTEHSRLHSGQSGQYFCADCDKRFSSRQGFTIHGRIHSGERPYGCRFCSKAFRDGGTLKKHERIHTGERPHECPLCHKCYNQKVVLREHVRAVHVVRLPKDNDGQCPVCRMDGMRRDELSEHIVRHSDELKWRRTSANNLKLDPSGNSLPKVQRDNRRPLGRPRRSGRKRRFGGKRAPPKKTPIPAEPVPIDNSEPGAILDQPSTNGFLDDASDPSCDSNINGVVCPSKIFECEMCHLSFSDRTELVAHVMVHI